MNSYEGEMTDKEFFDIVLDLVDLDSFKYDDATKKIMGNILLSDYGISYSKAYKLTSKLVDSFKWEGGMYRVCMLRGDKMSYKPLKEKQELFEEVMGPSEREFPIDKPPETYMDPGKPMEISPMEMTFERAFEIAQKMLDAQKGIRVPGGKIRAFQDSPLPMVSMVNKDVESVYGVDLIGLLLILRDALEAAKELGGVE